MLESLPGEAVVSLLPRLGYVQSEKIEGRGVIFKSTSDQIAVPTNKKFRDFGRATLDLLEQLVTPGLALDDLIAMLVLPDSDVYRHKFDDDLAKWGSFPLPAFTEAIPALLDLLKFTAAGVYSQRPTYTRVPDQATHFSNGCRIGQTEQSSYVVKIFCPTNPERESQFTETDEPFGRLVTRATMENLSFLAKPEAAEYEADLPIALNKNVAGAIARLRPLSFHQDAAALFWLSASYSKSAETETSTVKIDQDTFTRAIAIERRLTTQTGLDRLIYKGYIVDLHKDRPQKTISHKVTLELQEGGGWRKATITLLPSQYRDAIRWHDRSRKIRIDALFDMRIKPMRVVELFDFVAIDAGQMDMFDETPTPTPPTKAVDGLPHDDAT